MCEKIVNSNAALLLFILILFPRALYVEHRERRAACDALASPSLGLESTAP